MAARIILTSITDRTESSCHRNPQQVSRQRRKRRRPLFILHHTTSTTEGLYLSYLFYILCYTILVHDGAVNTAVRFSKVMGMMSAWKDASSIYSVGVNDESTNSNQTTDSFHWSRNDAPHNTKQRFLRWIRRRRRERYEAIENIKKYHIPIIDDPGLTFHLRPTSILSVASERRKLLLHQRLPNDEFDMNTQSNNNSTRSSRVNLERYQRRDEYNTTLDDDDDDDSEYYYKQWFAPEETSAVYATIPDQYDSKHRKNRELQEYYALRHLSRYEHQYRVSNQYNLQLNWNGLYDTTFMHQIVHFDDDIFHALWDDSKNKRNFTDSGDYDLRQPKYKNNSNDRTNYNTSRIRRQKRRHYRNGTQPTTRLAKQHQRSVSSTSVNHNYVAYTGGIYNNYQSVPLSQGYGTHFANVWVGTPVPQRKTVIVDTGSHYTAFPCTGCKDCGAPHHTDPYYRPENSKTFQQLQCNECQDGVPCEDSKW
jgi:Xylanase inhibitor N-terminal